MNTKELYIGVMSGTSLDGVDIALCEISTTACLLKSSKEYPFPQTLKTEILHAIKSPLTLHDFGKLDHQLGKLYAEAINAFLSTFKLDPKNIQAIGLHGQTLWHEPESETPFSLQLGDANIVAAVTGIQTIADFRRMDIANGGQGAPFAPAFHQFLFLHLGDGIAVVNIGGMANITLLSEELLGWDSGPGNVLLDYWANEALGKAYDKDGDFARSGRVNRELLNAMLEDKYFQKAAPKSTGREYFNAQWLEKFNPQLRDEDLQRTLLELTALTISNDLKIQEIKTVILCGGGTKNSFLMQRLQSLNTAEVTSADTLGVNSDALEAMAFAWLAYKRVHNEAVDLKSVTGARKNSLLGAIYG